MRLNNDFSSDEPYATEPGCPTLTVITDSLQVMIPYHSFQSGVFEKDLITLKFQEGTLTVSGKDLDELWRELQIQDVRVIQPCEAQDDGDCCFTELRWERAVEKS